MTLQSKSLGETVLGSIRSHLTEVVTELASEVKMLVFVVALLAATAPALEAQDRFFTSLQAGYSRLATEGAGGGSVSFTGGAFYRLTPAFSLGAEVGYNRLGTQPDVDPAGPLGGFFFETTVRSVFHANAVGRIQFSNGFWRPYIMAGAGLFSTSINFTREAKTGTGRTVDELGSSAEFSSTDPGVVLAIGSERMLAFGGSSLGMELRWHRLTDQEISEDNSVLIQDIVILSFGIIF